MINLKSSIFYTNGSKIDGEISQYLFDDNVIIAKFAKSVFCISVVSVQSREIIFNFQSRYKEWFEKMVYLEEDATDSYLPIYHFFFSDTGYIARYGYLGDNIGVAINLGFKLNFDGIKVNGPNFSKRSSNFFDANLPNINSAPFLVPLNAITTQTLEPTNNNLVAALQTVAPMLEQHKGWETDYLNSINQVLNLKYDIEVIQNILKLYHDSKGAINASENKFEFLIRNAKTNEVSKVLYNNFANYFIDKYPVYLYNSEYFIKYDGKLWPFKNPIEHLSANLSYKLINQEYISAGLDATKNAALDFKTTFVNEVVKQVENMAKVVTYQSQNVICFKNGYLTIDASGNLNFEELAHSKAITFTHINSVYNPTIVENRKIDSWLEKLFARDDKSEQANLITAFWQMMGSTLVDNSNVRSAFLFKGRGKNGKSTMLNFITRFLGHRNVSALSYEQISGDKSNFSLTEMRNKKANVTDEMVKFLDASNGVLKSLISGGQISSDVKYEPLSKWVNTATLIFATNYEPRIGNFNLAIADRFYIIELRNRFDDKNGEPEIKNYEKYLLDKVDDFSYVINKAVQGLRQLIANNWKIVATKENSGNIKQLIFNNEPVTKWLYDAQFIDDNFQVLPRFFETYPIQDKHYHFANWLANKESSDNNGNHKVKSKGHACHNAYANFLDWYFHTTLEHSQIKYNSFINALIPFGINSQTQNYYNESGELVVIENFISKFGSTVYPEIETKSDKSSFEDDAKSSQDWDFSDIIKAKP